MDLLPALVDLSDAERIYVESRLRGLSLEACARAAGFQNPRSMVAALEADPRIVTALRKGREISAQETGVTRKTIEEMLLRAYDAAATAGEMVMAARELARLHGLNEPTKHEVKHTVRQVKSEKELKALPTEELERLAHEDPSRVIEGDFEVVSEG